MIGSVREELLEVAANAELELGGVRELVEQAVSARAAAHLQVVQFEQLSAQATTLLRKLVPVAEKTATLVALADLINGRGQNARKMSLRSYVLSARLTDIANAASARLRTMSQGRYHLVRSDGPERSGMRTGLGLDVHDEYTGRIRPAKTLSGGESFLASLSLALGLVDVVSAESGGIQLDTLFIDEGFGSLDSSTLEEVLGVLDELRAGGRVVGVVSHVEELRHRIPTRLRVSKSPAGSSVSQI
jgi:exonuclease SbcC